MRSARATAAGVRAGTLDPREVVAEALAAVAEQDPGLGAVVHLDAAGARAAAGQVAHGPLAGVPVLVKDLMDVAGQLTRAGSRVPPGPVATADAVMVARVRAAGAVVLGRTRTHEFAWGVTTQHEALGGTGNPHDRTRIPGGSSGGSAAAVAAGMVPLALGTDTACSLRLPAAWCGLVGLKPTHGLVPLHGVVPLAPSLDHGGALVRTVDDARLAHEVLSGEVVPVGDPRGLRVGVVATGAPLAHDVSAVLDTGAARLAAAGLRVGAVDLGDLARLGAVYAGVQAPEALAWHRGTGRWPRHSALYGSDVRGHLERAEALSPEDVVAAGREREILRARLAAALDDVDVLLLPVAGAGPPTRENPAQVVLDGALVPVRTVVLGWCVPASLAGLPAVSVPAGLDGDGMPVGLQVVGRPGADAVVLDVAERLAV